MKTVKQIFEMATNIGKSYSRLDNNLMSAGKPFRQSEFDHSKKHKVIGYVGGSGSGVKLHHQKTGETQQYSTNDHHTKETLHTAIISHHPADEHFPYDSESQGLVDRVKSNDRIPKGHATEVTYNHFKKSKLPLRSSSSQYSEGHKMWHRLVGRALDDGHHVYHWDGKKLHKTTKENVLEHLKNSFGYDSGASHDVPYEHRHMIISKHELK
jgi:hypothetical protein